MTRADGAERALLVSGGNVEVDDGRRRDLLTNWPVHIAVLAAAVLSIVFSPVPVTVSLATAWMSVYLLGNWACVVRRMPGAGIATVVLVSAIALALLAAAGDGVHMFVAFPLVWVFLPTLAQGMVGTLALSAGMVAVMLSSEGDPSGWTVLSVVGFGAAIAAFSCAMGAWVWRIETLSAERRALATQLQETVRSLEETRAELAASERRRGADEESRRMSAEIHDTLAQSFTSIAMLAQAARGPGTEPSALLAQIEAQSREGLAEARGLISRSQAPLDLTGALRRLGVDLAERTGIVVEVEADGWEPGSTRADVVLLRTVQEGLRNLERHAGASRAVVRLRSDGDGAVLEVADDGTGFDPDLPSAGYGLAGMRARLEAEGGALTVDSARGAGTRLRAVLPKESHDH